MVIVLIYSCCDESTNVGYCQWKRTDIGHYCAYAGERDAPYCAALILASIDTVEKKKKKKMYKFAIFTATLPYYLVIITSIQTKLLKKIKV